MILTVWLDDFVIAGYCPGLAMRTIRRLRDVVVSFTGPFTWVLGLVPPVILNAISSFCAALFVLFMFGFFAISARVLLH